MGRGKGAPLRGSRATWGRRACPNAQWLARNFAIIPGMNSPMKRRELIQAIPAAVVSAGGLAAVSAKASEAEAMASSSTVFELRVYHPSAGKLPELLARFRDHTMKLFEKHGIKNVAYWTPTDAPQKGNLLVYMLAHPSREAADANWKAFREDPEWIAVKQKSEVNGALVEKIDSTYLMMTEFSPQLG